MAEPNISYMRRTFELALRGSGNVSPNPMVGCVIVKDDQIIGEGWHEKYGASHAEVNAVNSVADPELLRGATVYVNLEPCSYFGKTPPCANMLADLPINKVVFSSIDPNPKVSGNGKRILAQKGIEVTDGVLSKEGKYLNRRFFTYHNKKRPYILLKWAQTKDGFIARPNGDSKWISNEYSRKLVHKWRSEERGIMVGANTALQDNPGLTVRDWSGRNPIRLVIDPNSKVMGDLNLFDQSVETLVYNAAQSEKNDNLEYMKVSKDEFIKTVIEDLYDRKIQSVLVEGGSYLLNDLIRNNLWDEARVFESSTEFNEGIAAPSIRRKPENSETVMGDTLFTYLNQ